MRAVLSLLLIVPLAWSLQDLPSVRDLLARESPPCEEFIEGQLHTKCHEIIKDQKNKVNATYIYQIIKDALPFSDAAGSCISKGGYLASINSEAENNFIQSLLDMEGDAMVSYWLGGQKTMQSSSFHWEDGTKFQNFASDQTVTGNGDCLAIQSTMPVGGAVGDWVKDVCTMSKGYVCKYIYQKGSKVFISHPAPEARLSWYEAEERCMILGGNLATVYNNADMKLFNCFMKERSMAHAYIGLNDLNKELDFQWSDYSLSKFKRFCHGKKPTSNVQKDCVTFNYGRKVGCYEVQDCRVPNHYICRLRNPLCDAHQDKSEEYLLELLKYVSRAKRVCKPCRKRISHQKHAPKQKLPPKKYTPKRPAKTNPLNVGK